MTDGRVPDARPPEWRADVTLDRAQVRALIAGQFPDLALAGLEPFAEGWDNALWTTRDGLAFRFPRRAIAVPGVEREIAVLPALAPWLPLPIPVPVHVGHPDGDYPWPFFGTRLMPGRELAVADVVDRAALGAALGGFLRALHAPARLAELGSALPRDPNGRATMAVRVPRTRQRLETLSALGLWLAPLAVAPLLALAEPLPDSTDEAVVHGDLHVRHVLVGEDGGATGVIDWGDVCVADPSIDLALYWSQLDAPGREAFRDAYGPATLSPDRLLRARVLALFLDAALAAYAHDTGDPVLLETTLEGLERTLAG